MSNPMPWDQRVDISDLKTGMAVEGNQQADVSELLSDIISGDKLNVNNPETIDLGTGVTLKENVGTDTSSLASGEKMINDSERNNAARDASMSISGVDKSQQADLTELSHVLPSSENLNDNPELKKDDVREDAEVPDASKVLSPKKVEDGDASTGINIVRDETEKPDASRTCGPAKGEDGDVSKTISLMQDQDDDDVTEKRTNKLINEGGDGLNSPPVLSKCSFAVHGVVLAAQNREGQSESKRLVVSRERKQSKYLSPPYVNLSKGLKGSGQENFAVLGVEEGSDFHGSSPPATKSGSKGKKRELSPKSIVSAGNLQEISASSGELLSELHLAALDCLYPCEKEYFDPIEVFFTIFRSSVFQDKSNSEVDKKDTGVRRKELVGGICEENASDMEVKSEAKKRKRKEKPSNGSTTNLVPASLNDGNVNVAPTPPFAVDYAPTGIPVIGEAKPTTANSLDFSEKDTHSNSESLDFSKDLRKTISVSFEDTEPVSIPDLNGNSMNSNVLTAGSQSEGPSVLTVMPGPKKPGRKKGIVRSITNPDGNDSFMNSEELAAGSQSGGPSVLTGMPGPKKRGRKKGIVHAVTDPDGNDSSMISEGLATGSQSEGPSVLTGMPGPKNRGRKKRIVRAITNSDGNYSSMNSDGLATGSQLEGPSVLTGMPGPKKRGRKKGTARAITNPDGNDSSMNREGLAAGSQSESLSVLTGMSRLKRQGGKKGTVLANTSPDGNGNSMNSNGLAAGSQSEDPSVLNGIPAPRKRERMELAILANTNPDGNQERKKRRRRRKDGTYADDMANADADAHILDTTPISLEVCLRNVEPTPPVPMCPLNTSPSLDALPGEAPSLDQMKKSLGLMTTTLEKSWNNLPPEMKGTIEIEVQALLKKINTMSSSSSS